MVFGARALGKDEVAGSNPAISSMAPEDVVSMAPGVFLLPIFGLIPTPPPLYAPGVVVTRRTTLYEHSFISHRVFICCCHNVLFTI